MVGRFGRGGRANWERLAVVLWVLAATPVLAADPAPAPSPAPASGKAVFDRYCAECHAPGFGHPGTQQLGWIHGKASAVLETRKDLLPAYVARVVRNGLVEMPPFRPSEIDDAALAALVQYLAPSRAPFPRRR